MGSDAPPFTMKAIKTKTSMKKGKGREMRDEDFEMERVWLLLKDVPVVEEALVDDGTPQDQAPGDPGTSLAELNVPPEEDGGLECGCCFSPAPFVCIPHPNHSEIIN